MALLTGGWLGPHHFFRKKPSYWTRAFQLINPDTTLKFRQLPAGFFYFESRRLWNLATFWTSETRSIVCSKNILNGYRPPSASRPPARLQFDKFYCQVERGDLSSSSGSECLVLIVRRTVKGTSLGFWSKNWWWKIEFKKVSFQRDLKRGSRIAGRVAPLSSRLFELS